MDAMDHLAIRFHFGGYFVSIDRQFKYVGGSNAMSYVEIDKLSLPEIKGHLADHVPLTDSIRLHWLMPGMEVDNGLQLLVDDSSCQVMYEHMGDGGVVEIYVEGAVKDKDLRSFREFYKSPSKQSQAGSSAGIHVEDPIPSENSDENVAVQGSDNSHEDGEDQGNSDGEGQDSETSDEDYQVPIEEDSSAEDEEAEQLRQFAKEVKRNIKARKIGVHGSQLSKICPENLFDEGCNLEDEAEPCFDSSEDYSYD